MHALVQADTKRKGAVETKDFERAFAKLCGGEGAVKSDLLADIERYVDPQRDGTMAIITTSIPHPLRCFVTLTCAPLSVCVSVCVCFRRV